MKIADIALSKSKYLHVTEPASSQWAKEKLTGCQKASSSVILLLNLG